MSIFGRRSTTEIVTYKASTGNPGAIALVSQLFTKVVSGVTQLFAIASDGTVTQLTVTRTKSCGIYGMASDQANVDAVNEIVVLDTTGRACTGVSLSSNALTFGGGGVYTFKWGSRANRTSGSTASNIEFKMANSSNVQHPASTTGILGGLENNTNSLTSAGSPRGVVDATGGDITLSCQVSALTLSSVWTMQSVLTAVMVVRVA